MRTFVLSPLLWLAAIAAGIGVSLYGGSLQGDDPMAPILFIGGGGVAVVALVMLVISWRAGRRRSYAAAVHSADAVARWQVYPSDQEAFRAVDAARSGRLWSLKNALALPDRPPPEGYPVVVGHESLLVGDRLYDRGAHEFGTPGEVVYQQGTPGFIEISCLLKTTKAPLIQVLRFPVPASAEMEAARAHAHLAAQVRAEDRDRIRGTFPDHFEAADQRDDSPHRLQQRRKWLLPLIALFILAMAAFVFIR
ncbi:MAG: hypothetical protein QOC65_828 [Sphingomonadales bacterium]|nr:hypothetical protein [Sphingomonadales bacterium]